MIAFRFLIDVTKLETQIDCVANYFSRTSDGSQLSEAAIHNGAARIMAYISHFTMVILEFAEIMIQEIQSHNNWYSEPDATCFSIDAAHIDILTVEVSKAEKAANLDFSKDLDRLPRMLLLCAAESQRSGTELQRTETEREYQRKIYSWD